MFRTESSVVGTYSENRWGNHETAFTTTHRKEKLSPTGDNSSICLQMQIQIFRRQLGIVSTELNNSSKFFPRTSVSY